ncbi:HEAT repeat domain-containing protein [Micromonospora sp. DT31]|uniref:HEAT repeat domain-containing protein n=1 Tax=Micromonospora sp. DT31 TaxID=3393434 RepID=UPI003CEE3EBA
MFDGLDAVAWGELSHAYGNAHDTPGLLRRAGSEDSDAASEALSDLHGSIFHQGTVYPATVPAVPFLAELAVRAVHRRDEFAWMLGMLADPRHAYGVDFARVRAAVTAQRERLVALLDDADARVREAAAYATAKAGVAAEPLWRRWAVEDDPTARASLALALGEVDSAGAEAVLGDAARHGDPPVRVAAAVALLRSGRDWPAGTIPALVAAIDDDAAVTWAWAGGAEWSEEIVTVPSTPVAVAVVEHMLRSGNPRTRVSGLWAIGVCCQARRSAPPVFVPLVAPLLDDPDADVRGGVTDVLRQAGAAAGRFADVVADAAGRFPDTAGERGFTVEYRSVETLQRLGDPRWVEPVCVAAARGHRFRSRPGVVRCTPEVLAAVRGRLGDPLCAEVLAGVVGQWGTDADVLVPDLLAALPHAGPHVAAALLMLGYDDHAAVPHWRARAVETGDLPAALAVRRLTGDTDVVLDALRAVLGGHARVPWRVPPGLGELGAALRPLLPVAAAHLTGTAERVYPQRERQVLAARVVAAVAGPEGVLPTVEAVLVAADTPARHAADLIADLACASPATVAHLQPRLRDRLGDRWSRVSAAGALARLGIPTAELTEPLSRAIADYDGRPALTTVLELRAVEMIPVLAELLDRDDRSGVGGSADDLVWADELFQERVEDVIARLRAVRGPQPR